MEQALNTIAEYLKIKKIAAFDAGDTDTATMGQTAIAFRNASDNSSVVLKFRYGNLISVDRYGKQPEGVVGKPEKLWTIN